MSEVLPLAYLARHGETAWSLSGQHTGRTDLPLTKRGERNARAIGERLQGVGFARVFTSPLQRATRTCDLAGFADRAEIDRDLLEWDYGEYEVAFLLTSTGAPDWQVFLDGCPGGESPEEVRTRRPGREARAVEGDVLIFSSGHFLRAFCRALAWTGSGHGEILPVEHRELKRVGYERNLPARDTAVGRHLSFRHVTQWMSARNPRDVRGEIENSGL
jgi:probable phosphoglycerate mutase